MRILFVSLLLVVAATTGCKMPPGGHSVHRGPGVTGPGPGVVGYGPEMGPCGAGGPPQSSQLAFVGPEGMQVAWDVTGGGQFDSEPLVCPSRYNFPQGAIYRLKVTNIPGRPGVELYPTVEVGRALPRSNAFLAHNAIPVQFSDEDLDQVLTGNFVTKVIYLPDPEFQELALAGVETLVSTRLDPGVDPIVEADRRGSILAIVRMGNKDLQTPGEPAGQQGVIPTGYDGRMAGGPMPEYVAGATAPQFGAPITATPIGLPGPAYIPYGVPATTTKVVTKNPAAGRNVLGRSHIAMRDCPTTGAPCPTGGACPVNGPCPTGQPTVAGPQPLEAQ